MQLITENIRKELVANWQIADENKDPFPVVKLFNPVGAATWLLTEMVADQPDILFGLCDLGFQSPELGYVSLSEIKNIRIFDTLDIERDRHFFAEFSLSDYVQAACIHGQITFDKKALLQAQAGLESEKRRLRN